MTTDLNDIFSRIRMRRCKVRQDGLVQSGRLASGLEIAHHDLSGIQGKFFISGQRPGDFKRTWTTEANHTDSTATRSG
jgi:hypothetical protein